jgi:isopenicillin-N N-acyltransferase-like protein
MVDARAFSVIEVGGSADECGFTYGQHAAGMIARSVEIYLRLTAHHTGLNRTQVLALSRRWLEPIQEHTPDLEAEMRAIAAGAGVPFDEILFLNCRTEVLSGVPLKECTTIAAIPPATRFNNVLLGQTWDWLGAAHELPLVLKIRQTGKPEIVTLVEAGQLAKIGLNASGFGLCLNWLESNQRALGLPVHLLCRAMLNQTHIVEALNLLLRVPRAAAANYTLGSQWGFAAALETTPTKIAVIEPDGGLLVHTNHFLAEDLRPFEHGLLRDGADSLLRRQRAVTLLQPACGSIDRKLVESVLSDTACGPASISRSQADPDSALDQEFSHAGWIMDLSRMQVYLAPGSPSENPFQRIFG